MSKLKNVYFVGESGAARATCGDRLGARETLIARMEAIGYHEATYQEFVRKRAWQRRQEEKEADAER